MKLIILILSLLIAPSVPAQTKPEPETVDVSGSAEVRVAPDEVIFSLDVTNTDNDLQIAKKQNDDTVAKVLVLTKSYAIPQQDVKTDYISVDRKFEFVRENNRRIYDEDGDEIGEKTFKGYEISKTIIVRLKDLTKFEAFFSDVIKSGVTEINSVRFESSKIREIRDQARELAMKAAYEKAKAMAAAIGQSIGRAISIVEVEQRQNWSNSNAVANVSTATVVSGSDSLATFSPGAISVTAEVKVRFLLN